MIAECPAMLCWRVTQLLVGCVLALLLQCRFCCAIFLWNSGDVTKKGFTPSTFPRASSDALASLPMARPETLRLSPASLAKVDNDNYRAFVIDKASKTQLKDLEMVRMRYGHEDCHIIVPSFTMETGGKVPKRVCEHVDKYLRKRIRPGHSECLQCLNFPTPAELRR